MESTTPETAPPQPRPTEPAPRGGSKTIEDARALLTSGSLAPAAEAFAANVRGARTAFSIQILVACSDDTVQKAIASVPAQELFILPVHYKGKSCYRLCWGLYDSEGRAASALGTVPEYFRRGGASPKVVRSSAILP
jgi:septal ring-binding cell division protein DamX